MFLLLIIIYLSFISLGLPDSLLGSAWPSMYGDLGVSIFSAGIVSMIISGGTIISGLLSGRVINRLGAGAVTFLSVAITAASLICISISNSFALLCLFSVPLGLGAGVVDAALNNFVALHYKANHMSWLHCFWGVGASIGPFIMSYGLVQTQSWNAGYRIIGIIQFILTAILFLSLPLWKRIKSSESVDEISVPQVLPIRKLIMLPGAKQVLTVFFCYCGIEMTIGLWGSSYLVTVRGVSAITAASWISLYYFGITFGRLLSGFLSIKLCHKRMVQIGQILIGAGAVVLFLPIKVNLLFTGFFLLGLGCAPIYPSLIHETPINFGVRYSQSMIGVQMACAYTGTTFIPPLFGILGSKLSYGIFPFFVVLLLLIMIFMTVLLYKKIDNCNIVL
ncbi:MAG: MFS transporter [Eubacterium sp.]|jgi:fucose permease|nr:MFS transporter [Eubacterium sp.]